MENKLIIVIGAYGSGKSEYSINLANQFKAEGKNVILADLDVVNPYFRSRDVQEEFEKRGIEVIAPEGEYKHADLPMISPKIATAVTNKNACVILDVGGDPAGCRTLARFVNQSKARGYEMHFVVNTCRPFTNSVDAIIEMKDMLEFSSKLSISHLVCNTNLMQHTDNDVVKQGIEIVEEVKIKTNTIFDTYLVLDKYDSVVEPNLLGKNKIVLNYYLNKPWEL